GGGKGGEEVSAPVEPGGDALADADAHRDERVATAGVLQLPRCGQRDARAGSAQRVADGNRAAIHVDPAVVEGQFEPAQTGEHLGGKGLVDLNHVDFGQFE